MQSLLEVLKIAGVEGGLVVLAALSARWLAPRIDKLVRTHCRLMMRMRFESRRKTALLKQMAGLLRRASREHRALANAVVLASDDDRRQAVAAAASLIGDGPPRSSRPAGNSHGR